VERNRTLCGSITNGTYEEMPDPQPFIQSVNLLRERVPSFEQYPFSIPAIRHLDRIEIHPRVTFFAGENGTGKSTLLEAIAAVEGINVEGGSRNFSFFNQRQLFVPERLCAVGTPHAIASED